jgi:hypothetical protein
LRRQARKSQKAEKKQMKAGKEAFLLNKDAVWRLAGKKAFFFGAAAFFPKSERTAHSEGYGLFPSRKQSFGADNMLTVC